MVQLCCVLLLLLLPTCCCRLPETRRSPQHMFEPFKLSRTDALLLRMEESFSFVCEVLQALKLKPATGQRMRDETRVDSEYGPLEILRAEKFDTGIRVVSELMMASWGFAIDIVRATLLEPFVDFGMATALQLLDADGNGGVTKEEFMDRYAALNAVPSQQQLRLLWAY